MPRVVPSQIVALIDRVLSEVPGQGLGQDQLNQPQSPQISAVIDLASELPDEFLVMSRDHYSEYRVGINALKDLLKFWADQPSGGLNRRAAQGLQFLNTVRGLLAKCPDEIPSPATVELLFIQDPDLRDSIRSDISAANRALHDGLWKAATVLAGAAAEALLLWAIIEKKSATDIENARVATTPLAPKDPNGWVLDGYIKNAKSLGLIEDETAKQADIAREFRNLIHPGRAARLAKACDRGTALSALASVELIVRDLS
jgi:hypothetical protein